MLLIILTANVSLSVVTREHTSDYVCTLIIIWVLDKIYGEKIMWQGREVNTFGGIARCKVIE